MSTSALGDLIYLTMFLGGGLVLAVSPIVLAFLLAPLRTRMVYQRTLRAIECGMESIGPAWIRFGVVYYLYALIFVAFAVDVLFLLPVAVVYNEKPGWLDLFELLLFVGILALVIVYAWKKGVFLWSSKSRFPKD